MNVRQFVKDLGVDEGESLRINCPVCGKYNTFTVHNDMGSVVYNCYSLGCGTRGAVHVQLTAAQIMQRLKKRASTAKEEIPTWVIPEYVTDRYNDSPMMRGFIDKWQLKDVRLMYDVKDRRAVFPIHYKGRVIDAVGRSLNGAQPKWLRYSGNADVYTYGKPEGVAVIVEDVISAIVATRMADVTGVAILGTSLGPSHIKHLETYSKIIVALDPDALSKTLMFKRSIESWLDIPTYALKLTDDIKYNKEEDIVNLRGML